MGETDCPAPCLDPEMCRLKQQQQSTRPISAIGASRGESPLDRGGPWGVDRKRRYFGLGWDPLHRGGRTRRHSLARVGTAALWNTLNPKPLNPTPNPKS